MAHASCVGDGFLHVEPAEASFGGVPPSGTGPLSAVRLHADAHVVVWHMLSVPRALVHDIGALARHALMHAMSLHEQAWKQV